MSIADEAIKRYRERQNMSSPKTEGTSAADKAIYNYRRNEAYNSAEAVNAAYKDFADSYDAFVKSVSGIDMSSDDSYGTNAQAHRALILQQTEGVKQRAATISEYLDKYGDYYDKSIVSDMRKSIDAAMNGTLTQSDPNAIGPGAPYPSLDDISAGAVQNLTMTGNFANKAEYDDALAEYNKFYNMPDEDYQKLVDNLDKWSGEKDSAFYKSAKEDIVKAQYYRVLKKYGELSSKPDFAEKSANDSKNSPTSYIYYRNQHSHNFAEYAEVINATEEEIKVLNYINATQGDEAEEKWYRENLQSLLKLRQEQGIAEREAKQYAEVANMLWYGKALATAITIPQSIAGGFGSFVENIGNQITGQDIDTTSYWNQVRRSANITRSAAQEDMNPVGAFFYNAGLSTAESLIGGNLIGKGYSVVMGMSAASNEAERLQEKGATKAQIALGSLLAGTAEALFEEVSLDKLLKTTKPTGFVDALKKAAAQAGVEASEEVFTEIANTITNCIVMGKDSDFIQAVQEYQKDGETTENARRHALFDKLADIGLAGLSGAVSGGLAAGGQMLIATGKAGKTGRNIKNDMRNPNLTNEVIDAARSSENEDAKRNLEVIDKAVEQGKDIPDVALGNLAADQQTRDAFVGNRIKQMSEAATREVGTFAKTVTDSIKFDGDNRVSYTQDVEEMLKKKKGETSEQKSDREFRAAQIEALRTISEITGVKIGMYASTEIDRANIADVAPNGWYDANSNTLYVDANAGANGAGLIMFTAAHEFTHATKTNAETEYNALRDFLKSKTETWDADVQDEIERLDALNRFEENATEEDKIALAEEELTARSMEGMLKDGKVINALAESNPNVAQKIFDFVKQIIDKLKTVLAKLAPESKEAKALSQDIDTFTKAQELYTAALKAVGQNVTAESETPSQTAENADTEVSDRNSDRNKLTAEQIQNEINGAGLSLTSKDNNKNNQKIRQWLNEHYPNYVVSFANDKTTGKVTIKDVNTVEERKAIDEKYRQTRKRADDEERFFNRIKTSSGFNSMYDSVKKYVDTQFPDCHIEKSHSSVNSLSFYIDVFDGDNPKGKIKISDHNTIWQQMEYDNAAFIDLHDFTSVSELKATIGETISKVAEKGDTANGGQVKYSDRDSKYMELAKDPEKNKAELRKMAEEAAKEAGYGSPLLYHGTDAFGFTAFDLSKMDDKRSIFLTDSERIASTYSGSDGTRQISKGIEIPDNIDPIILASELNAYMTDQERKNDYSYMAFTQNAVENLVKQNRNDLLRIKDFLKTVKLNFSQSHYSGSFERLNAELEKPYNPRSNDISTPLYMLAEHAGIFAGHRELRVTQVESNIRLAQKLLSFMDESGESDAIAKVGMEGYDIEILSISTAKEELIKNSKKGNYALFGKTGNLIRINSDGKVWKKLGYDADVSQFYRSIQGAHGYRIYNLITGETLYISDAPSGEFSTRDEAEAKIAEIRAGNDRVYKNATLNTTREISEWASGMGYDGIVFEGIIDNGGRNATVPLDEKANVYVYFSPDSVKSADPVTYDAKGNVIPLSERFNTENNDIRYSDRNPNETVAEIEARYEKRIAAMTEQQAKEHQREQLRKIVKKLAKKFYQPTKEKNIKLGVQPVANEALKIIESLQYVDARARDIVPILTDEYISREYPTQSGKMRSARKALEKYNKLQAQIKELNDKLKGDLTDEERKQTTADVEKLMNTADGMLSTGRPLRQAIEAYREDISRASVSNALNELRTEYDKLQVNNDSGDGIWDERVSQAIATAINDGEFSGKRLSKLDSSELKSLVNLYRGVYHTMTTADKLFGAEIKRSAREMGKAATESIIGSRGKRSFGSARRHARKFRYDITKAIQFFDELGSPELTQLYKDFLPAEKNVREKYVEITEWMRKAADDNDIDLKTLNEVKTVKLLNGNEIEMTVGQLMKLYALSQREQAMKHIKKGGVKVKLIPSQSFFGKLTNSTKTTANAESVNMTDLDIIEAVKSLSENARKFVDDVQAHQETLSKWGNVVSRALYGIDIFTEKNYTGIKSDANGLKNEGADDLNNAGMKALENAGFTMQTVPNARNPIEITDFAEDFISHAVQMANYSEFVLPLKNFRRVMNYQETVNPTEDDKNGTGQTGLRDQIEARYGSEANAYINQLLADINGTAGSNKVLQIANALVSKMKKTAVAASLSTVVQQPTAIIRAMSMISPTYFTRQKFDHIKTWQNILKYTNTGIVKDQGGYDVGTAGATNADIYGDTIGRSGIGEASKRIDDISMWGAEFADQVGWNMIWRAAYAEQVAKVKRAKEKIDFNSDEFLRRVGERFDDVIIHTQVYDSVLSKAPAMRSKDGWAKMATAFMAEPLTSVNMVVNAAILGVRGTMSKSRVAGTVTSVIFSSVAASFFAALVYAMRDDDEDETYGEKLSNAFAEKMFSELNPANQLPLFRDVMSIIQGYDVERTDMSLVSDLVKGAKSLVKAFEGGNAKDIGGKSIAFIGSVCNVFGLPIRNVLRDVKAIAHTVVRSTYGYKTTVRNVGQQWMSGMLSAFGVNYEMDSKTDKLYYSFISGDTKRHEYYKKAYKTEQDYHAALRTGLAENDVRISLAAKALNAGQMDEYEAILDEIGAEGFEQEDVRRAIRGVTSNTRKYIAKLGMSADDFDLVLDNYEEYKKKADSVESDDTGEYEPSVYYKYNPSDVAALLVGGNYDGAKDTIDRIIAERTAGMSDKKQIAETEKKARASIKSAITEKFKDAVIEAYADGDRDEINRIGEILLNTGLYGKKADVKATMKGWAK